jgi:hypothetical protein
LNLDGIANTQLPDSNVNELESTAVRDARGQLFDLARTCWSFSRGDGSILAPRLQFQLGGRIRYSRHANESLWTVRNGNLCFLNPWREMTTEFTDSGVDCAGRRVLRGAFLPGATGVIHQLTEIPALGRSVIPNPAPRVAVLVRTHVVNDKVNDLISVLSDSACFDLFVCADCTNAELVFDAVPVLRHRADDADKLLLPTNNSRLLWYCGDYALYFSYVEIPDYDYYVLIEYDVDLPDRSSLLIEGLINRLDFSGPAPLDFVGCVCWQGGFENGWGRTVMGTYPEAHLSLFPFVVLSRPAIEYLLAERRAERNARLPSGRLMFCEAFVPSALNAGGFRRADLNQLIPRAYERSTFRIPAADDQGPMLLGHHHADLARTTRLIHPVYDERNFVDYHLKVARRAKDASSLAALLAVGSRLPLSERARSLINRAIQDLSASRLGTV